ncbi:unnamed protein product [Prorocentrum cordatum]|uniref:TsaA-like domain-containing protein n=1 Tax=Prorocentrum cordatum TaxID=2364126 RepID=A0ABN9UZT5_9DINO|nr:unnamed protein product [Polarella glacialis]
MPDEAIVVALLTWAALRERARALRAEREAREQRDNAARQARLRDEERKGRVRAERQLREAAVGGGAAPGDGAGLDDGPGGFVFHPIGVFSSCYRSRCGTPRQGGIVQDSLAVLRCVRDLNPAAALEGLEESSATVGCCMCSTRTRTSRARARRPPGGGGSSAGASRCGRASA